MIRPRILVTGFGPFPGAPLNPTRTMVEAFRADPARLARLGVVRTEVLDVDYAAVPLRLAELGTDFAPDIAIHFGLSDRARGFTLERLARNEIAADRPDNSGAQPLPDVIEPDGGDHPSGLPLGEIAETLDRAGLPWSWSDDAGGYLCNYLFYLSRSPDFPGFAPAISGFVHVPPLKEAEPENAGALPLADLVRGAKLVVAASAEAWRTLRRAA